MYFPPQVPSVLSAAYSDGDGKAIILANSNRSDTECTIVFDKETEVVIKTNDKTTSASGKRIKLTIPALDAALVIEKR